MDEFNNGFNPTEPNTEPPREAEEKFDYKPLDIEKSGESYTGPLGGEPVTPPAPPVREQSYTAPAYQSAPQQGFNPAYGQNPYGNMNAVNPASPKKKKSRTISTIVIIAVVCCAIAICGMFGAKLVNRNDNDTSSSYSEDSGDSDKSNSSDAEAKIEKSDSNPEKDDDGNLTAVGVAKNNKDSCVGITVYTDQQDYYFYNYGNSNEQNGDSVASGEGSGVIMAESGGKTYIMTCAHVIADGSSFKVTLENDKEYDAEMVGYDSQTDIGVLSINATGLQIAKFGDSNDIEVGEDCVAIGCPGGLAFKNSVTKGIISALDVPVASQIGYDNECIQVDTAINPGNSGGALFNMQGQVIGINSSKIASTEYEGMGFAVPSNTAVETANSLIKNGYVAGRAKVGIEYTPISSYTSANNILNALAEKGFKDAEGTMVINTISDESDLKNKDVKQYDMIVAVNGKTMTSIDVMTSTLSDSKPGDTITLTIARVSNNSIKTFDVKCKLIESKE